MRSKSCPPGGAGPAGRRVSPAGLSLIYDADQPVLTEDTLYVVTVVDDEDSVNLRGFDLRGGAPLFDELLEGASTALTSALAVDGAIIVDTGDHHVRFEA